MKNVNRLLFALLLLTTYSLSAADANDDYVDQSDIGSVSVPNSDHHRPYSAQVIYDYIYKAKIQKKRRYPEAGHISFNEGQAQAGIVFYFDPEIYEGLNFNVAYTTTNLHWRQNPYFHQSHWDTLTFSLGGFSKRACGWLWIGQANINMDAKRWNFDEYSTYDFLLWGRYEYCQNIGLSLGFLAQTGMHIDHVYPVIGFDWQFNEDWKINAIFPLNMSIVYTINEQFNVAAAARYFDSRHRAGRHAPVERSLYFYRSLGIEGGLNYQYCSWINANVHAGYMVGGKITIGDRHWHHKRHYDFDGAPYFGGEVKLEF